MADTTFQNLPDLTDPDYETRVLESSTVKEMAPDAQPRERALRFGIGSLSNSELFAIILRVGRPGRPITSICDELMRTHANMITNLERLPREQFMSINGIGDVLSLQIEAVMEIVRRYNREKVSDLKQISMSRDIYDIMRPEIGNLPHEEIWVIFTSRSNKVLSKYRITSGSSVASIFDVKKIMRMALLARAEGMILCHNHPSGTCRPSGQDDQITRKLKDACKAMDLTLLDHVIVTSNGYFSYRDSTSILF